MLYLIHVRYDPHEVGILFPLFRGRVWGWGRFNYWHKAI